jgi:hypothetical protein
LIQAGVAIFSYQNNPVGGKSAFLSMFHVPVPAPAHGVLTCFVCVHRTHCAAWTDLWYRRTIR